MNALEQFEKYKASKTESGTLPIEKLYSLFDTTSLIHLTLEHIPLNLPLYSLK